MKERFDKVWLKAREQGKRDFFWNGQRFYTRLKVHERRRLARKR